MTGAPPPSGRLTPRQAVGWGVAFLVIVILVMLFFLYGPVVRPVLGATNQWESTVPPSNDPDHG